MAQKTYVDPLLSQFALGYQNNSYIGDRIAPTVPVKKATGKFGSYGMDNLRIVSAVKGDDAESRRQLFRSDNRGNGLITRVESQGVQNFR